MRVLTNDTDVDGDTLAVTASPGRNGTVALNATGRDLHASRQLQRHRQLHLHGQRRHADRTATVTITVTPVNDAPVAANDSYTTNEDTLLTIAAPGVLANDTDVDSGDARTAIVVTDPAHGTLSLSADGSFTYSPMPTTAGPTASPTRPMTVTPNRTSPR